MSDMTLHILLPIVGAIFSAGGFYVYVRLSLTRLKEDAAKEHAQIRGDLNNMGRKLTDAEKAALRRHHNVSLVLMLAAPLKKEHEICELLKEG